MEFESIWGDSKSMAWLKALSLPTLEWAIPFLPLMGLPDLLLKDPKILITIYTQAITEFNTQRQNRDWALAREGDHGELMREVVTNALQNLAIQMGRKVAVDLERWVLFHFFCNEAESAMFQWDIALRYAYVPKDSRRGQRKISPPVAFMPLLPEIWDLVNLERTKEIRNNLMRVAPAPDYEQSPYEYMEKCYEATMLSSALEQALTLKALQTIASRLDYTQRQEVVKWAQTQIQAMDSKNGYIRSQKLCGDKYLQVEPPGYDFPSVLDFPTQK